MSVYTAGNPWKIAGRQRIMEAGDARLSKRGIELATMPEVAAKSGVGRTPLFRFFHSGLELIIAIGIWKRVEYIVWQNTLLPSGRTTSAEGLLIFPDAFLNLYRNHADMRGK